MIVGIKEEGNVVLAYSSFEWRKDVTGEDTVSVENAGVWKIKSNPHTIMGGVAATAESDAFRYEEGIFSGEIDCGRLETEIIPAMEKFAEGKDYIGDENGRYDRFLIAQNGRLFDITSEHVVSEVDSFIVSGGHGEDFIKSVLYATQGEPTIDRIRKAFEFAAWEKQSNCYPIAVMDTKTGKLRILTRERD